MRVCIVAGLMCVAGALASCGFGQFNSGSKVNDTPASDAVTQVNPKAFNAFDIWNNGGGAEVLDYPQGYQFLGRQAPPDGVFYVERARYRIGIDGNFLGVPTEGAKVVDDVLEYPVKNGKQLKLKFTKICKDWKMEHHDAVSDCWNKDMRLPTARELFDFCAAGVTEPNYGPNFKSGRYRNKRCWFSDYWSASVLSDARQAAWVFRGGDSLGYVSYEHRSNDAGYGVLCVSEP